MDQQLTARSQKGAVRCVVPTFRFLFFMQQGWGAPTGMIFKSYLLTPWNLNVLFVLRNLNKLCSVDQNNDDQHDYLLFKYILFLIYDAKK
jgi:hypothetical protein